MDNRLKTIMENYDSMVIGLDDTFNFHCKMCGRCCIHREDILLNPHDIYRIARALNKEPRDIFSEYCEVYVGHSSKMVLVRLIPRGNDKRCPFLSNQKCSIHKYKPTVCALYPLGRSLKAVNNGNANLIQAEVNYIFQKPACGDTSETHTVREWLSDFDFLADEEYFKKWMQLVVDLGKAMRSLEAKHDKVSFDAFAISILGAIYLDYDINEPFVPQFENNQREYRKALSKMLELLGVPNVLAE